VSLINTIGPVILLVCIGLAALLAVGAWASRVLAQAQARRELTAEARELSATSRSLISDLVSEMDSNLLVQEHLPDELQQEVWRLHERYNSRKELMK
jgi:hypothetical protein